MHLSRCAAKLSLRGLTELADTPGHLALAAKLASQQGNLVLDGIERLGPKVAVKLSGHGGRLALRGLTEIDEEVLAALFSRSVQPELSANMLRKLFVHGSGRFIAQYCVANDGDLGILQSLSTNGCDLVAAKAMVDADVDLCFDEVCEIAPEIGSVLATSPRDIRVGYLASLSEESARALRKHSGTLIIGTLSEVSLGAAKALAEHRGPISIEDTEDLPEDVAAVLDQRSESGDSEQDCVEQACELLNTVEGLATYHPADLRDVDFKQLAAIASEVILKLRGSENVGRPAAESTCGVLERLQELADQDLTNLAGLDFQQLANDAEAASCELRATLALFENFTPEMEELYRRAKQASQDELTNARLYCHSPEFGRNSHEAFFEFFDTLSKCRRIPLWLMYDEKEESWNFFQGTQEEIVARLSSIAEM